jgi:AcrR family transcriptional regulator
MEDVVAETGAPRRGRPPVSEEQRQRQRLDISRHAIRLFAEQGVTATSGEQIARAAGVSERTLWRHFQTKESCVAPLLATMVDGFQEVLRAWPAELELTEYLQAAYLPVFGSSSGADIDAVLSVVRMTHGEPALRAVYLVLRERAEATFADVLARRSGLPAGSLEIRVQAAAVSAVLKAVVDHLSYEEGGVTTEVLEAHSDDIAAAVRNVLHGLSGQPLG